METGVIRRVVRAPREGWLELVVNGGGEGGVWGKRTEAEPEVCVGDVWGHGEAVRW